MELNWIQKHALLVLVRQQSARVKELTPRDVPSNLFAYHLDGLVAMKLIEKTGRGVYSLTTKGQKFVGSFSTLLDRQVENIKTVIMLVAKHEDKHLLFRWSRQPYLGHVTPLYDRMPAGKSLEYGIDSAFNDKLGIVCSVTFKTSVLIKIMHDGELVSHMNALVYETSLDGVMLPFTGRNGEAILVTTNEINGLMSGVDEFFAQLEDATQPFESIWQY